MISRISSSVIFVPLWLVLGTGKTHDLSSERIGGFTGAFIGMYATGNGKSSSAPADFDWLEYTIQER